MKRSFMLSLSMVLVLFSCETDPGIRPDPVALALNEIDKNHIILVDAYKELSNSLSQEAILTCRKAGGDQIEFMQTMYEKSNEAFEKVLVNRFGQTAADYYMYIDGIKGNVTELFIQANSTQAYASEVSKRLKEKSSSVEEWSVFKRLVLTNGQTKDVPTESVTFNFEEIKAAISLSDIILDLSLSDQERTRALQDALDVGQIPPVAIGLLLPAVQKAQEAAEAKAAEEMYLKWIEEEVIPTTSGGLDRDIIRRKCFFEYLGALELIISQNYDNDNQLGASIAILKARYDYKLLSLWADFWHLELAD